VSTNLALPLNRGRPDGTDRMITLGVDHGFEHGPGWSFAPNPEAILSQPCCANL
jgi:class I fructose-bisphosphate aldolase